LNEEPATQSDLESWGRDIFRRLDERMDVVFRQLAERGDDTHTVALMAAVLYGKTSEHPDVVAKGLYRKIQTSLKNDRTVVGRTEEKTKEKRTQCRP
jgi:hypothetical protein